MSDAELLAAVVALGARFRGGIDKRAGGFRPDADAEAQVAMVMIRSIGEALKTAVGEGVGDIYPTYQGDPN
jgi:hypothetical protein